MRRTIIHIGYPKTGTTSIQHFCGGQRAALAAQGIVFPRFDMAALGNRNVVNHLPLVTTLMLRPPPRLVADQAVSGAMIDRVFAEFKAGDDRTLLLSHESLSQRKDLDWRRLRDLTAGTRLVIVVYLRVFDDWIDSLYGQHVRDDREMTRPFEATQFVRLQQLEYLRRLREIRDELPGCEMIVRSYDRFRRGGLVEDFVAAIGGAMTEELAAAAVELTASNRGLPGSYTMFVAYATFGAGNTSPVRAIVDAARRRVAAGAPDPLAAEEFSFVPPAIRRQARESYVRDLPALRAEFGLDADEPPAVSTRGREPSTRMTADQYRRMLEALRPELPPDLVAALEAAYEPGAALLAA